MKILISILFLATAVNCGSSNETAAPKTETTSTEQPVQEEILVGKVQLEDFRSGSHAEWFEPMIQSFEPDEESVETVNKHINDYNIKAFMGTWCADSRREIPKLYKLLEMANYDLSKLEMIAVKEDKTSPGDIQEGYDIQYVPTIIFYKDGEEVGRFVEYSQEDFEQDIAKIVSGEEYKHPYE